MNKYCCADFEMATIPGTDNEGYGSALWQSMPDHGLPGRSRWNIGCTKPIKFCPWCGKRVDRNKTKKEKP